MTRTRSVCALHVLFQSTPVSDSRRVVVIFRGN
jgi:hypothetical protein